MGNANGSWQKSGDWREVLSQLSGVKHTDWRGSHELRIEYSLASVKGGEEKAKESSAKQSEGREPGCPSALDAELDKHFQVLSNSGCNCWCLFIYTFQNERTQQVKRETLRILRRNMPLSCSYSLDSTSLYLSPCLSLPLLTYCSTEWLTLFLCVTHIHTFQE